MLTEQQIVALEQLGRNHPRHYMHKFCERPAYWYAEAAGIAEKLGLWANPVRRILDLGCGFGYFVRACLDWGHEAEGLDVGDAIIWPAAGILNVRYCVHQIRAYQALPSWLSGYDLITMFGVNLRIGGICTGPYWGWPEYRSLVRDVLSRLRPGGRFIMRPNGVVPGTRPDLLSQAEWQPALQYVGHAVVTGQQVEITSHV